MCRHLHTAVHYTCGVDRSLVFDFFKVFPWKAKARGEDQQGMDRAVGRGRSITPHLHRASVRRHRTF